MSDAPLLKAIRYLMIGSSLQFIALIILDGIFLEVNPVDIFTYKIDFTPLNDIGFTLALLASFLLFVEFFLLFLFFMEIIKRFSRKQFMLYLTLTFLILTFISRTYVLFIILFNSGYDLGLTPLFQQASGFAFTAYFIPAMSSTLFGYIFLEIGKERFSYGFGRGLRYFGISNIALSAPMALISLMNLEILSAWNFMYFIYYWKVKFYPLLTIWILDQWVENSKKERYTSN